MVEGHFTHEPRDVTMKLWEPKWNCPKVVPRYLQNHIVWSQTLKCSVKSYVTGPSSKCYFNEYLFMRVLTHDKDKTNQRLFAFMTLFRSITMFCGTDNIPQAILHIQTKYEVYSIKYCQSHVTLLWTWIMLCSECRGPPFLCWAYLQEVVFENSPSDFEIWSICCHVGIHIDFTSILHSHTPLVPQV
jgi:hypothetical protein